MLSAPRALAVARIGLGLATILVELFLAVGLWMRRTRRAACILGRVLHVSIVATMSDQTWPLLSFAITCVSLYALLLVRPSTHVEGRVLPSSFMRLLFGARVSSSR